MAVSAVEWKRVLFELKNWHLHKACKRGSRSKERRSRGKGEPALKQQRKKIHTSSQSSTADTSVSAAATTEKNFAVFNIFERFKKKRLSIIYLGTPW
jgi:type III secretory pathway component EscU